MSIRLLKGGATAPTLAEQLQLSVAIGQLSDAEVLVQALGVALELLGEMHSQRAWHARALLEEVADRVGVDVAKPRGRCRVR